MNRLTKLTAGVAAALFGGLTACQGLAGDASPGPSAPTTTAASPTTTFTDDDYVGLTRAAWLAGLWQGEGEPPTPLPVVRESNEQEYIPTVGRCMEDAGWMDDGPSPELIGFTIPEDQTQVFWETYYQCYAQYPLAPKFYQPYNVAQLIALHAHQTGVARQCLIDAGFPPDEPPSLDKFVSDWQNQVTPRWFPYDNVPDAHIRKVESLCPLWPEGFYDLATPPES